MGNYVMKVDFLGNSVRAIAGSGLVCLSDLVTAGNSWRLLNGLSIKPLSAITRTQEFKDYLNACSEVWGVPSESLVTHEGRGRTSRTMGHLGVAVFIAEQMSPAFHAAVIREFVENKLLEYRQEGGEGFKKLCAGIDLYLPDRQGKDNRGCYVTISTLLRSKVLGPHAKTEDWNEANAAQTYSRSETERCLVDYMRKGLVRDFEHLMELAEKSLVSIHT